MPLSDTRAVAGGAASGGRVLLVDDEPRLLRGLVRVHKTRFDLTTAASGREALDLLEAEGPFAVVVSDLRMPDMDGLQLLEEVRRRSPDTVRMLLTATSELASAARAINDVGVFRFLTKPCDEQELREALEAGLAQHRLVTAEKVLLERTLTGAVQVMTEILASVNPDAFGRARRVAGYLRQVLPRVSGVEPWVMETAALLSQIGCVIVPPDTLARALAGADLDPTERATLDRHPGFAAELLARVPRLDVVAEIIAAQDRPYQSGSEPAGDHIPVGARLLKIALDLDALVSRGRSLRAALHALGTRRGVYDPKLLELFEDLEPVEDLEVVRVLPLGRLCVHMVVDEDLVDSEGCVLVPRGHELTSGLLQRLHNYAHRRSVREPVRVRMPQGVEMGRGEAVPAGEVTQDGSPPVPDHPA